jgi:hypothetical protein
MPGRYRLTIEDSGAVFTCVVILAENDEDAARQAAAILTLFPDKTGELEPIATSGR